MKMGKYILFLCMSCLIAIILSLLILNGSKIAFGIIILIFLAFILGGLIFKVGVKEIDKYILYFIIVSIPFPYLLQFLGRDALTVTTIMIYFLFIIMALHYLFERKGLILEPKFIFILPVLIFGSLTISIILNPYFISQSIKYYIANVSGILLYFIVLATIKKDSDVTMVIKIVIFTLVLESGIILLVWKFPVVKECLKPFTTREISIDSLAAAQNYMARGIIRFTGTIWDYELLAEWFLVGSILSIGLFYKFKKNIYIFSLFCCLTGIIFTITRSVFFLLILGLVLIFALINILKKDNNRSIIRIILLLFLSGIILFKAFPKQIQSFAGRLEDYFQQPDLFSLEAINRKAIWEDVLYNFLKKPTIFGKGLYNVEMLYYSAGSFHSLYLTILYKIGILGLTIHSIFWLKMLYESWRILVRKNKCENWYTLFFLIISLILILIDEIKVEYLRYGHTIQFVWLIYGLLIVSIKQSRENNENIMVSQASI